MKKVLAFLLITVIACAFEEENLSKVKQEILDAIDWMHKKGIWAPFYDTLMKHGKEAAINLCKNYFTDQICIGIIAVLYENSFPVSN